MCEVPKVRKDFEAWCFLGTERKPQRMEQGEGEKVPRTGTGRTLNFSPSQREFSGRSKYINFFFLEIISDLESQREHGEFPYTIYPV